MSAQAVWQASRSMGDRNYRLIVEGELGPLATRAFDGMDVAPVCGNTVITGRVRDQSDLHALLHRVGDLGLTLVSVAAVERARASRPAGERRGRDSNPRLN
jgi:hypothetical protein